MKVSASLWEFYVSYNYLYLYKTIFSIPLRKEKPYSGTIYTARTVLQEMKKKRV